MQASCCRVWSLVDFHSDALRVIIKQVLNSGEPCCWEIEAILCEIDFLRAQFPLWWFSFASRLSNGAALKNFLDFCWVKSPRAGLLDILVKDSSLSP